MKFLPIALSAGLLVVIGPTVSAKNPTDKAPAVNIISQGEVTPTPEMWFYQQYQRQYQTPQEMVHRNADFEATQRMRRLSAMKWYGKSNQRPRANTDPYNSDYSATWVSGNPYHPNHWVPSSVPTVILSRERGY